MCAGEEEGAADLQRDDLRCGRRRAGDILDPSLASCARRGIQVRAGRQSARMEAAARSRSGNAPFSNSLGGVIEFSTSTFSCALRRARPRPRSGTEPHHSPLCLGAYLVSSLSSSTSAAVPLRASPLRAVYCCAHTKAPVSLRPPTARARSARPAPAQPKSPPSSRTQRKAAVCAAGGGAPPSC